MRSVPMDMNAMLLLSVTVSADVVTSFDDQNTLPLISSYAGKTASKEACANNYEIVGRR